MVQGFGGFISRSSKAWGFRGRGSGQRVQAARVPRLRHRRSVALARTSEPPKKIAALPKVARHGMAQPGPQKDLMAVTKYKRKEIPFHFWWIRVIHGSSCCELRSASAKVDKLRKRFLNRALCPRTRALRCSLWPHPHSHHQRLKSTFTDLFAHLFLSPR